MAYDSSRPRFEVGRVFERTFGVIGDHPALFLGLSAVLAGVPQALFSIGIYVTGNAIAPTHFGSYFSVLGGYMVLMMFCGALLQGTLVAAAVRDLTGETITLKDTLAGAARKLGPLLAMGLIYTLAIMAGFVVLVIPGLILMVLFYVAGAALMIEDRGALDSFGRSIELTRGRRWLIFLFIFILGVVTGVASIVLNIAGLAVASAAHIDLGLVRTVLAVPLAVAQMAVFSAGNGAVYVELRNLRGSGGEAVARVFD